MSIFCDNSELSDVASVCSDIFTIESWKSSVSNLISGKSLLAEVSIPSFEEIFVRSNWKIYSVFNTINIQNFYFFWDISYKI